VLVKELQSLGLSVDLTRSGDAGEIEIDAESVIAERLDDEITDLGAEKIIEGEAVVADMPLVDLAAGSEDEFETLDGDTAEEEAEVAADTELTVEG